MCYSELCLQTAQLDLKAALANGLGGRAPVCQLTFSKLREGHRTHSCRNSLWHAWCVCSPLGHFVTACQCFSVSCSLVITRHSFLLKNPCFTLKFIAFDVLPVSLIKDLAVYLLCKSTCVCSCLHVHICTYAGYIDGRYSR